MTTTTTATDGRRCASVGEDDGGNEPEDADHFDFSVFDPPL